MKCTAIKSGEMKDEKGRCELSCALKSSASQMDLQMYICCNILVEGKIKVEDKAIPRAF